MPRKLRELRSDLRRAGWNVQRQTGSHQIWLHPQLPDLRVNLAGGDGTDARPYQERDVAAAVAAAMRAAAQEGDADGNE